MDVHFSRRRVQSCHGIFKEMQDSKIIKNMFLKNTLPVLSGIEQVFNICMLN